MADRHSEDDDIFHHNYVAFEGQNQDPTTLQKILIATPIVATVASIIMAFVIRNAERSRITSITLIKENNGTIKKVKMKPDGTIKKVKMKPDGTVTEADDGVIQTESTPFQHKDLDLIKPGSANQPFSVAFLGDDFIHLLEDTKYDYDKEPISPLFPVWSIAATIFIIASMIKYREHCLHWSYHAWHVSLSIAFLIGYICVLILSTTGKSSRSTRKIFAAILGLLAFVIAGPFLVYLAIGAIIMLSDS